MGEGASGQRHAGTRAPRSSVMNEALIDFIVLDAVPRLLLGAIPSSTRTAARLAPQPLPALAMGTGRIPRGHPHPQQRAGAAPSAKPVPGGGSCSVQWLKTSLQAGRGQVPSLAGCRTGRDGISSGKELLRSPGISPISFVAQKNFLAPNEMGLTRPAWSCGRQHGMRCQLAGPEAGFPAGRELSPRPI